MELRTLTPDELRPAFLLLEHAFGTTPHEDDVAVELAVADPARTYGAFDGQDLVATAGSFAFEMAVPGAVLPVAGVTWVAVRSTARRQGVLTALMGRQLSDLHDEGTAVAALWASEPGIYGRFGYGPAAWVLALQVPRGAALLADVPRGGLRLVEPTAAALRPVYDAVAAVTPGFPARDDAWWAYRLHDPERRRDGGTPLQCLLTDGGYALYSVVGRWADALPQGTVQVRELVAVDAAARARLWRALLDEDLTTAVHAWAVAPDDPLVLDLLADPRAARPRLRDALHVRLVDLPAALAGRRYAADVDVVLEVEDRQCPWNTGRWRLSGGRSGAACAATTADPDLVLTPADLGAAYLGGTPLRGRRVVERTPGALAALSTALGPTGAGPWCPQVF